MGTTREFYEAGFGDRFNDPLLFNSPIANYLSEEEKVMDALSPAVDLLIEVGCMHGRYLDWAVSNGKYYIGIDMVHRYIDAGQLMLKRRGLSPEHYKFLWGGAEDIPDLVRLDELEVEVNRCVLLFPFNSFGNMDDPLRVIRNLQECGLPFFISTYLTSEHATRSRGEYYVRCGYKGLYVIKDEYSVGIISSEGLQSFAYRPEYLLNACNAHHLGLTVLPFAGIGLAYVSDVFAAYLNPLRTPAMLRPVDALRRFKFIWDSPETFGVRAELMGADVGLLPHEVVPLGGFESVLPALEEAPQAEIEVIE